MLYNMQYFLIESSRYQLSVVCSSRNVYLGLGTETMVGLWIVAILERMGLKKQRGLLGENTQKNKRQLEIGRDTGLPLLSTINLKG